MDAGTPGRQTVLEREECLALLAERSFGRVAVALGEGPPVIRPVNYVFDVRSQSIVFMTGEGTKLHALLTSAGDAAFEIDEHDPQIHAGFSVIVIGVAGEVTVASEVARLERTGLKPYAPEGKHHWVQIRARTVSGLRIGPA